jgi:3-oxoacyl-(acyl-carrier-protein) synthase
LGIVAAPGFGVDAVWKSLRTGASGLRPLTLFDSPRYGQVLAGEAPRDLIALGASPHGSRSDQLGVLAARQAVAAAHLDLGACGQRAGVLLGCSVGGSYDSEHFLISLLKRQRMRARPTRFHECTSVVDLIADEFGCYGPSMALATACSSGALAIATAADLIRTGEADVMLAGGADSLSHMTWGGFHALLLVDPAGCRPFDVTRAGTSLGEGAAVLVIEAEAEARRRGATILARLTGWGASCDAHHATAPHPHGEGAAKAMSNALRRAGLASSEIGYVNAHGTGTRNNDLAEAKALRTVFGDVLPPVSSTKGFFGHALAASGAIEALVCIEALRRGELPPNAGFAQTDPAIGFEPLVALTPVSVQHVMSNSFGFGGNNACLIFSRSDSTAVPRPVATRAVAISGLGLVGPGSPGLREIEPPLPSGSVAVFSCGDLKEAERLTSEQRRRLSRLIQMTLLAAQDSRKRKEPANDCGTNPSHVSPSLGVMIGTGMGCLEDAGAFIENLVAKDEREAMPSRFPNSVHNAPAAQVAIQLGARGLNSAPTAGEISFECALWQGRQQLAAGEIDEAIVGAVDELNKYVLGIGNRWGFWNSQHRPGEGAMAAELTRIEDGQPNLGRVSVVKLGRYRRPFDPRAEAEWIEAAVELAGIEVVLTGLGGWPALNSAYAATVDVLSTRAGRTLDHRTYKQLCGEYHAASGFGFAQAVQLLREGYRGVLTYTLSQRGGKAICYLQA